MEGLIQFFKIGMEPFIANIGLLLILAWLMFTFAKYFIHPSPKYSVVNIILVGTTFGVISSLTQLFPAELMPGVFIDTRGVPLMFSGIVGGPVAAIIATFFSALTRYWLGGIGANAGLMFAAVYGLGGIAAGYILRSKGIALPGIRFSVIMSLLVSLSSSVATLFLPAEIRLKLLANLWPSLVVANIIGSLVFAKLLQQMELQKKYRDSLENQNTRQLQEIIKKQKYLDILNIYSPGAIAMFDKDMRYLLVSDRWLKDYGREGKNVIGMSHYEDFPEIPEKWRKVHQRGLAGEVVKADQDVFYRADGVVQWVRWEVRPWYTDESSIGGIIIFSEDITRVKELEEEKISYYKKATELAEAANLNKSQFLANMSHELRTPMNAVLGFSEMALLDKSLSTKTAGNIHKIHEAAESLLSIIDSILDLAKLEKGKLKLEQVCFRLTDLIEKTTRLFGQQANKKGLRLRTDISPEIPDCVTGDPTRLRQVFVNLIGNAIKFTNEGQVTISGYLGNEPDTFHFIVTDTGIGISQEKIDKIFNVFSQADSSTTRKFGGTGLGTTISKELIEMMSGQIWVKSEPGKGSEFHFIIKLKAKSCRENHCRSVMPDEPVVEEKTVISNADPQQTTKILLVEDSLFNQELIAQQLGTYGAITDIADNGETAIEKWLNGNYQLIISDISMPVMDGYELIKRIRKHEVPTNEHVPVIAMTANAMPGEKEKCLAAGFDDYCSKPIRIHELEGLLNKWL